MLGTGDTAVSNVDMVPVLTELSFITYFTMPR